MFENLSIELGADTGDLQAGLAAAREAVDSTADEFSRLGRKADSAEEDLGDAGRRAATTGGIFTALSLSTSGLSLSLGALSTTLTASLIPALIALSTALAPLAATVGGLAAGAGSLAAAFGAVAGSGIIAFGAKRAEQNKERLSQIRNQVTAKKKRLEQIETEIDRLQELREVNDGLTDAQRDQLQSLVAERVETENAIDKKEELAKKTEKTTDVAGALSMAFGEIKTEIKPLIVSFGQQFIPLVEDAIDALPDLVENILDATGNLSAFKNALRDFGQASFRLLPRITDRVFDLARRALPVLIDGVEFLLNNGGNIFDGILSTTREVAPLLLSLSQTFADIAPTINDVGTTVLNVVVPALEGFLSAINKLLQGDIEGGLIDPIKGIINDVVTFLNSEAAQTQLDKVSSALFGAAATALNNTSESDIAGVTGGLGSALTKAVSSLTENFEESGLAKEIGVLVGDVIDVVGTQLRKASNNEEFQQEIATIGGNIGSALGDAIVAGIKESLTDFQATDLLGGVGFAIEAANTPSGSGQQQTIPQNPKSSTGGGQSNQNVTVTLEGDTGFVKDAAAEVVDERERAAVRETGGTQTP